MKIKRRNSGLVKQWNWKTIPWYVLIFSVYPICALLAHNATEVPLNVALLPLVLSVASAGILLLFFGVLLRNWHRAALLTTILLVLFFSYGHIYSLLKGIQISSFFVFRHRTLVPLWIILGGLGVWWVSKMKFEIQTITKILNVIGIVLIVMPVFQISLVSWKQWNAWKESYQTSPGILNASSDLDHQETPDIYYIILDSYGRADKIRELYGYDNSGFLNSLQEMGFFVTGCSQSNYAQTLLSLASSLNLNYLDALSPSFASRYYNWNSLTPLIKNSALRQFLKSRGYKTIAFATGFIWTEINDADIYLSPKVGTWELNAFQYMLLQTTAGRVFLDAQELRLPNTPDDLNRRRTQFTLTKLKDIPLIEGPKFIFAHILVPHTFIFGSNGEARNSDVSPMTPDVFKRSYIDSLIFINKQVETIVTTIIATSPTPPVIIIQGDHGPTGSSDSNRVSILNAYYLPGHEGMLYTSITPVNTFRVVLDAYFGQDLPLLPDISRFSTYENRFEYSEITNDCN